MSESQKGAIHLDSSNFQKTIESAGDKPVLVDFFAEWCGPCKMAAPIIDKLADKYKGKAIVAKLDVDNNQDIAALYGVMSIPTVMVFKNGKLANRQIGFIGEEGYEAMITSALGN